MLAPCDWVYVNNFDKPYKPIAIPLPRMRAQRLSKAMVRVIDELRSGIPGIFEAEEYQRRRRAIDEQFRSSQEEALEELNKKAEAQDIAVLRSPTGFAMAPAPDGTPASEDFFEGFLTPGDTNCFIPQIVYSTTFGFRSDEFEGDQPATIADVFDLEKFPGKRSLEKKPIGNLEWALIADGVRPQKGVLHEEVGL